MVVRNPDATRRRLRYVIIGAGMAGLLAAIRLRERGDSDFIVYEKGDKVGGTWRENRYPGLTCDVHAHAYTYSFAPYPDWSRYFAPGPEIQSYFEAVTDRFGVRGAIRFNTEITDCRFVEGRWRIQMADGTTDVADVVIAATGVLHHPNIPAIPGLEDFAGAAFHSARWPDDLSLENKSVGIVGSGSTGVQLVCGLADHVKKLVQFSRSPQWIMPGEDFAYSDSERQEFRDNPEKIEALRGGEEFWARLRHFNNAILNPDSPEMAQIEALVRHNLETSVADPVLRERLRPNYRAVCKRIVMSPNYYECVQRPNVEVETGKLARVERNGVRMEDGALHELDAIVLATGFRADRFVRPIRVRGLDGMELDEVWAVRPNAYLAITVPQFPNFFMLNGPAGPVGNFSLIDVAERQWGYIDRLLEPIRAGRHSTVAVRPAVLADYENRRIAAARTTIWATGCTSWYLDSEGVPASWPWTYDHFAEEMATPRMSDFIFD